ncbi:MAG TPA: antibiotic biosynthesis monooxygenase family protein [Terriglobales bacterium]|nr:antibiotic biosynthesis monooxygenase family protein [Terriglobales bacterium]
MKSLTSHEAEAAFAVLSLFTSGPEHRQEFVTLARDFLASRMRWQEGLHSVELFSDESGEHIVILARWQDRAAFEAFKQSPSGREVTSFGLALRPKVLFLRPEASFSREAERTLQRARF